LEVDDRRFPQQLRKNELGDPPFLFHLFKENTILHDIPKYEEFFIIQFLNIPIDSLLQSYFMRFTGSVQTLDSTYYFITFIFTATLRHFTATLYCYHKNNTDISLLVTTLFK